MFPRVWGASNPGISNTPSAGVYFGRLKQQTVIPWEKTDGQVLGRDENEPQCAIKFLLPAGKSTRTVPKNRHRQLAFRHLYTGPLTEPDMRKFT